ncbi:MAG: DUF502 domain-containing protein [Hyphomicrobiales bacterium]
MSTRIQRNILTGLLTVIPLAVTWYVFDFVLGLLARFGSPVARWLAELFNTGEGAMTQWLLDPWFQWTLAIFLTVFGLYLLGLAASFVIGQRLIGLVDSTLERMPVVKKVYGATRRLVEALSVKQEQNGQRVVMIDFPVEGMKAVGFVTKTMRDRDTGEELFAVFVPTTPNPTSGYLEILPASRAIPMDFTFDEAMSFIITGGTAGPEEIAFSRPPAHSTRTPIAVPPLDARPAKPVRATTPVAPRPSFPRSGMTHRSKTRRDDE